MRALAPMRAATGPLARSPVDGRPDKDPERTDPERTDPERTDPERTDPERTDPERTDPERTAPERTGPGRTRRVLRRLRQPAGPVLDALLLAALTVLVAWSCGSLGGFPKGYDAWGHLSKARMTVDSFPDINWNDEWYAGQPAFLGSYPPGYHFLLAAMSWATGSGLPFSMMVLGAVSIVAVVEGGYLLVLGTSGSRIAAWLSGAMVMASPTVWDQVIELGLYPRFTSFSFGTLAAGCAAFDRRSPSRLRATLTVVALAAALGTHPVSGGISCGVVGLILLCAPGGAGWASILRAAFVIGGSVAVCGWFYLPLVLVHRAQSAFTDIETPLRWVELGWPTSGVLSALAPITLVGTVVIGVAVLRMRAEPRQPVASPAVTVAFRDRRGDDVSSAALQDSLRAADRRVRGLWDVMLAAGLTAASLIAVGYGMIGHFLATFPYYVNGLQPRDLLVYPAWLLSAAIGIGGHHAVRHRRRALRVAVSWTAAVLVAASLAVTVVLLPSGLRDGGPGTDAMIGLLPPDARDNHDHRIAGASDLTSRWINAVTSTPQLRGYDDHGNLHLDWQFWLEQTLNAEPGVMSPPERRYLLDYFAARWLLTETPDAAAALAVDRSFRRLGREQVYADVSIFEYLGAHPITTAITAPTVLFVGDDRHYDLLLRVLALADVGADRLLPVHGPASLSDVTAAQLAAYPAVMVYGATLGRRPAVEAFASYVRSGGRVFADVADSPVVDTLARAVGAPVTSSRLVPLNGEWRFTGKDARAATGWSPPTYEGTLDWDVRTPLASAGSEVLLAAGGRPVLVRKAVGAGSVTWSGLNLPYHAASFAQAGEAAYLGRLLGAVDRAEPVVPLPTLRPNPQHRTVTLPPGVDQVLVREYRFEDWHATVDGRAAQLLAAGPDMMFVRVPPHAAAVTVRLEYRLGPAEQAGSWMSVLAVVGLIGYAVVGEGPFLAVGLAALRPLRRLWRRRSVLRRLWHRRSALRRALARTLRRRPAAGGVTPSG